ncbi:ABC transporter permease [Psychromonas sp. PT13]|uniref:ABC transporter permease n=1 Tax=Psychromonas sp. PT13 TaxID=3439547 RepID=UPI003EBBC5AA
MLIGIWAFICAENIVPAFMLPSPLDVAHAFIRDFSLLMQHTSVTLVEAFWGLSLGIIVGFIVAVLMDEFNFAYRSFYPLVVLTQTIPTIAIAPLLVLWMGYGMAPKMVLVALTTFFPITIGLLDGFKSADKDMVDLMRAMGAGKLQIFRYIKLPGSMTHFFSSLKISVTYSIVAAVISEWLGGFEGLGVYMIRVKKSYAFDEMFAVIFLISILSLVLMKLIDLLKYTALKWERAK